MRISRLALAAMITLCAQQASAQQNPLAFCMTELYPALSLRLKEEGDVQVRFKLGTDGVPHDVVIEKSSGKPRLDQATLICVKTFRFRPAMKDGQPLEISMRTVVPWSLDETGKPVVPAAPPPLTPVSDIPPP